MLPTAGNPYIPEPRGISGEAMAINTFKKRMGTDEKANLVSTISRQLPQDPAFIRPGSLGKDGTQLAKELAKDGDIQMRTPPGFNKLTTYVSICEADEQLRGLIWKNKGKAKWPKADVFAAFQAIETWTPCFFSQPQGMIKDAVCKSFKDTYYAVNKTIVDMGGWQAAVKKYKAERGCA